METSTASDLIARFTPVISLVLPAILTLGLYFLYKKRAELSRHAIQNTAATILVCGANLVATLLFVDDINHFFQGLYKALHVPTLPPDIWEGVPYWLAVLIGLAAKDLVDYVNHRLMHTRWGWPTHAAHHSDTHVNAFSALRVHFLESMVMSLSYILLLTWMQIPQAIPAVYLLALFHNMYVHMDLDYDHGPLRWLVASPVFHRWHHADEPAAYGKNLANIIPAWDMLFGTYYMPGRCEAPMGALKTGVEDKDPIAIMTYPFREWYKMIRAAAPKAPEPQGEKSQTP